MTPVSPKPLEVQTTTKPAAEPKPPTAEKSGKGFTYTRSTLLSSQQAPVDEGKDPSPTSSTGSTSSTISTHSVAPIGTPAGSYVDEEESGLIAGAMSFKDFFMRPRSDTTESLDGLPKVKDKDDDNKGI